MLLLGYDIGTSSIKAALVDAQTGQTVATGHWPETEAPIISHQPGWAEQQPESWWLSLIYATQQLASQADLSQVAAIGISYQMHGLVCVDDFNKPLRPSIIWCDGRAIPYGQQAFDSIGRDRCLTRLLNSPGNFTAAKLAWVKENEPDLYKRINKIMLPGDYIAMRLSGGETGTTASGLSEGILWDFEAEGLSWDVMKHYGFSQNLIPEVVPTFGIQCRVCPEVAKQLGIPEGTPISYRAGDQPNNALSLNVMKPGEVAATGGTSGVVYGVADRKVVKHDPQSRVNAFVHVNGHTGILLCINGTGILNAWMRRTIAPDLSYNEINQLAETAPVGAEGLSILPFGNGAERMLANTEPGASIHGLNFNIHTRAHLLRAAQEGIAFSFAYGMGIMHQMGLETETIKAGHTNLFLSPLFRQTLTNVTGATIELYDTDGAAGAARGAGIGADIYKDSDAAMATLQHIATICPNDDADATLAAYDRWCHTLINL